MSLFKFFTGMSISKSDFERDEEIQKEEDREGRERSENNHYENETGCRTGRRGRDPSDPNY